MEVARPATLYALSSSFQPLLASILLKNTGSSSGCFDYALTTEQKLNTGDLVEVPFRDKPTYGIVWNMREDEQLRQLKPVTSLVQGGILKPFQQTLAQWVAEYYYAPLAKVVESMVPEKLWNASFDANKHRQQTLSAGNTLPRGKRQMEVWQTVQDAGSLSYEALKATVPWLGKAFLSRIVDADVLIADIGPLPSPYFQSNQSTNPLLAHSPQLIALTASQKSALETISAKTDTKPYLLFGPPASGKTEVYLSLAKQVVEQGKQALILVPEIALTTQLIAYFADAFGDKIAVLHSQLNDTDRCIEWERLRTGEATVAIGSRIALFAPFANLGCICVDEEHEWTYKSEQTPRYHARDVAIKLAEILRIPIILGSATPSIESFTYARLGKYELLRLERISSTHPSLSIAVETHRMRLPIPPVQTTHPPESVSILVETQGLASLQIPKKFQDKYRIESTRLKGWDYSSGGAYFITICTKDREHFFGEMVDGEMRKTAIGNAAQECWGAIPTHFPSVVLDEFVVMPNHVHGIIHIQNPEHSCRDAINRVSTNPPTTKNNPGGITGDHNPMVHRSLSTILRWYKGRSTFKIHVSEGTSFAWQSRFYDHIIRDETSLHQIREYIRDNPKNWEKDKENEEGLRM